MMLFNHNTGISSAGCTCINSPFLPLTSIGFSPAAMLGLSRTNAVRTYKRGCTLVAFSFFTACKGKYNKDEKNVSHNYNLKTNVLKILA